MVTLNISQSWLYLSVHLPQHPKLFVHCCHLGGLKKNSCPILDLLNKHFQGVRTRNALSGVF